MSYRLPSGMMSSATTKWFLVWRSFSILMQQATSTPSRTGWCTLLCPSLSSKCKIFKYFYINGPVLSKFCQAGPGRLAVLLQAVQEGWSCLVSYPHHSYLSDPFIYLEERSSTSMWALSVYSDSSPHFGGVQSFCSRKESRIYIHDTVVFISMICM